MSYSTRKIKRDGDSIPVPQYFNDTLDDFEVQKGSNGAAFMQLTGSNATDGTGQIGASFVRDGSGLGVLRTSPATDTPISGYDGANNQLVRVSNVLKYAGGAITAGAALTVWTPTTGKKFRLLSLTLSVLSNADVTVQVRDGTNVLFVIYTNPTYEKTHHILLPLNGYLSALANNTLNIFCPGNASLTVTAMGVEE